MSTESFDLVSLGFEFHARDSDAAQKVFDALDSRGLIGYLGAPQLSDQLTYVPTITSHALSHIFLMNARFFSKADSLVLNHQR